ncbi:hypothetical protein GDO86_010550 [Hymenochirus boettgeri]|uniref:Uncharacterized protein n=1 Tax=Hymenochirus boettgeri TaxID=247094 RepID=A0A8T2JQT4_9PIPI|nr:hypothetical protein GDO86_010550 [Hymenochirus boettgeri]KAG8445804.1 hypothetical protein GDO86_010550 [Hymenochirus boettgeri]
MDFTLPFATYVMLALTLLFILNVLMRWNKNPLKNFPPGPKGFPLIGNLFDINLKKLHESYIELSKIYGPVFSIQLGPKRIVVLAGYKTVKDALVNHADEFGARAQMPIFNKTDEGYGLILSNGENWKAMRRFTITTLRDFGMGKNTMEQKIMDECDHLKESFASFNGTPFDDAIILNASVANILISILFGNRMDYEDPSFIRLLCLVNEYARLLGSPMVTIFNIFPSLGFLPGSHKTVLRNVNEMYKFAKSRIVETRKTLDENDQRNFLDAFFLRQIQEEENTASYFHDRNLLTVVKNLFLAGMETTSTTLRWGLLLMMKYPDIQEKVHNEIFAVIGSAQPNYNHRLEMPYTNAVIHEIQRFGDVTPLALPHETSADVHFKGYFIPKGTVIIPLLSSVLRDETQFDDIDEFNPNNFLDSEGNFVKKEAFMPFSAGRRVCAGETLARMELFIFFTSLLQKFSFRPPPGVTNIDLTAVTGVTNSPVPHKICAFSRD